MQHFLRGERGVYYEDLYPLISFLPRHADGAIGGSDSEKLPLWHDDDDDDEHHRVIDTPATELGRSNSHSDSTNSVQNEKTKSFDPEKALPQVASERPLKPSRNPPKTSVFDYLPFLRFFKWIARSVSKRARAKQSKQRTGKRKAYSEFVESHIPLEIILVLSK